MKKADSQLYDHKLDLRLFSWHSFNAWSVDEHVRPAELQWIRCYEVNLSVPLLLLVSAISIILLVRLEYRDRRAAFREKNGLCAKCGYDLRASCERCPECGTAKRSSGL